MERAWSWRFHIAGRSAAAWKKTTRVEIGEATHLEGYEVGLRERQSHDQSNR